MRACLSDVTSFGLARERGERVQAARERLVDLALHPGQRAQVEVGVRVSVATVVSSAVAVPVVVQQAAGRQAAISCAATALRACIRP